MSSVINTSGVTPGSIYRIYLKNFVTYKEVELYPGISLNIIIGPNGTGKSTILSAIILGLCGKPSIIGRMEKISEYIRSGCDKATIEIELYQGTGKTNVIIKRVINSNNGSTWCIDNSTVIERKVQELITSFNIQVGNLCQLLPQDRVQSFSELNPQELLKSTLSAVKGQESVDQLDTLINTGNKRKELKNQLAIILNKLDQLRRDNERLHEEVELMNKRRKYEKDIKICEAKKLWIEWKRLKREIVNQEFQTKQSRTALKACEEELKPLRKSIEQVKNVIGQMEQQRLTFGRETEELKELTSTTIDSIVSKQYVIKEAESTYKETLEQENNKGNELNAEKAKLEMYINNKKSFEEKNGIESELVTKSNMMEQSLTKTEKAISDLNKKKTFIEFELQRSIEPDILACKNRLRTLQSVEEKRLQTLKKFNKDTYEALMWLRENRHLFKYPIHDPMMLLIDVTEARFATYLEATVANRDLLAFTCEDSADMDLFLLRTHERGLGANAVCSQPRPPPAPRDLRPLSYLGFYTCLSQTMSAPPAVESFLCTTYGLHRIPLGDSHTYDNMQRVPLDVAHYFTERHRVSSRRSHYSGETLSSIAELRPARLLADARDADAERAAADRLRMLEEKKRTFQDNLSKINNKLSILQHQFSEISENESDMKKNIAMLHKFSSLIRQQKQRIEDLINQPALDMERVKQNCKRKQIESVLMQCNLHQKLQGNIKKMQDIMIKKEIITLIMNKSRQHINEYKSQLRASESRNEKQTEILVNMERALRKLIADADEKIKILKRMCSGKLPDQPGFPYAEEFKSLPSDLKALVEHRDDIESRMSTMDPGDEQARKDYEQIQREIATLQKKEAALKNTNVELERSLDELKVQWLTDVNDLIRNINTNFRQMFSRVDCVGEVKLEHASENDFSKYGIGIWVKFRDNEQLMQLSRTTQSGGERALSTALYLLALQSLSAVPFRCVDEINQGMDKIFERKMLQLLIEEMTEYQNSQYFLLTPKLLPSLEYNEHVTVHTVMNGKEIMNYKEWNYSNFFKRNNRSSSTMKC